MKKTLQKYCDSGQPVQIIYVDREGKLSQRNIQILTVEKTSVKAHCFTKHAMRSFSIDHILAIEPSKSNRLAVRKAS